MPCAFGCANARLANASTGWGSAVWSSPGRLSASHPTRFRASSPIGGSGAQSVETVLCPSNAKTERLLIEHSRLVGVSSHTARPPGRQHVRIVGLGQGKGYWTLPAVVGAREYLACT